MWHLPPERKVRKGEEEWLLQKRGLADKYIINHYDERA